MVPLGALVRPNISVWLPPHLPVFVFRPVFIFFFLWQGRRNDRAPAAKIIWLEKKVASICQNVAVGQTGVYRRLFENFFASRQVFRRFDDICSLLKMSHIVKKKKRNDLTDDKLCKRTNTSFSRLHIWTNTLIMVVKWTSTADWDLYEQCSPTASVSQISLFFCMINNVGVVRPNVCRSPFGPRGLTFCRRQLVPRQLTSHIHSSTVTHCLNLITGPFKCPSLRQTCLFLRFRGWCLWSCRLGLEFFFMRLEKVQVYWSRLWRDSWKQLTPKTNSADLKLNSSIKISLQRKAVKTRFNFCKKASQIIRFEFERNIRHIRNTDISSVYDPVWSEVFHSSLAAVFDGALSVPVSSILSCLNKNVIYIGILY